MRIIPENKYDVRLDKDGNISTTLHPELNVRNVLTQEQAANLAAHIVSRLEFDAWEQFTAWIEALDRRRIAT